MALKIGNLNLNLKTVQPKVAATPLTVIGFAFIKENVAKILEAARETKISLAIDEVNALTVMLPIFDNPQYDPKFAISGSPEMAAVIAKASPIFTKAISMYWERNFFNFQYGKNVEKEILEVVAYLKEHLSFFTSRSFKPKGGGSVKMKSADYVLNATRKLLQHFEQKKMTAETQEVWDFLTGGLKGLFDTIQNGRKLAQTYLSTGALIELTYNQKPGSTVEMAAAEVTKAFIYVQNEYAEKNQQNAHKASPITVFAEELNNNEYPLKTLITNVIAIIFNVKNFGSEEQLIEHAIEEANSEFEDSYEGLHKNSPASQTIEIVEPTVPTVPKKGK